MASTNGYAPQDLRILRLLADGMPHRREEVRGLWEDTETDWTAVHMAISRLRKHLRLKGEDIVCRVMNRCYHYQHVRLLQSEE